VPLFLGISGDFGARETVFAVFSGFPQKPPAQEKRKYHKRVK
jgi:hypothetical protein